MNLVENLFLTAAEEAAELAQKFTKASRFGLESTNPKTERKAAEDIVWEFNDLLAVIELLKDRGIQFAGIGDPVAIQAAKKKLIEHMEVSVQAGTLTLPENEGGESNEIPNTAETSDEEEENNEDGEEENEEEEEDN